MPRISRALIKLVDIGFLARPALLCASCTFFFAGVVAAPGQAAKPQDLILPLSVLPNLVLFVLIVSSAFVINQVFDVESDSVNRKTYILPSGIVSKRESLVFFAIVTGLALVLSIRAAGAVRYAVWVGLALGFCYSVPPVRLKGKAIADLLANVIGFGIIGFALGWLTVAEAGAQLLVRATPYALAMSAIFLHTCIPDESGDSLVGDRTSCVVFGRAAVSRAAVLLLLASTVVAGLVGDSLCALAAFGSMPAAIGVAVEPDPQNSVVSSQFAARLLFVLVSIRSPVLALLGVAVYVCSKLYYSKRLGLDYPNVAGARAL